MCAEHTAAEHTAADHSRVDAVLADLSTTDEGLARLAAHLDQPDDLAQVAAACAAVRRARSTIDAQNSALRELEHAIRVLGRQLVESHSRFQEWMTRPDNPDDRD